MSTIRLFASHDWGKDSANHARVANVVEMLRTRGFDVWFDETHMKGNILDAMCRGIDRSDIVLVFVTENYMKKVESGNESDNVRREFMYASSNPSKFVAIRFDTNLPSTWSGPVAMVLGSHLYVDLTNPTEEHVEQLVKTIRHKTSRTLWKTAYHHVRRMPMRRNSKTLSVTGATKNATKNAGSNAALQKQPVLRPAPRLEVVSSNMKARDRVQRVMDAMGDQFNEDEHIGGAVDRLIVSILGESPRSIPFHEKIECLETQLGLMGV